MQDMNLHRLAAGRLTAPTVSVTAPAAGNVSGARSALPLVPARQRLGGSAGVQLLLTSANLGADMARFLLASSVMEYNYCHQQVFIPRLLQCKRCRVLGNNATSAV